MEEKSHTYSDFVEAKKVLEKMLRNTKDPKKKEAFSVAIDALEFSLNEY